MQKRQVINNVIYSIMQFIVVGIVLLILYKFLIKYLGVERFGIWSLVLSTTSIAGIANLGFSASVVKFVAQYTARKDVDKVVSVIETSVISIALLVGFVLLICYPLAIRILRIIIASSQVAEAIDILPYALLSLWISVIASVFQAGLDGHQRMDLSSLIVIFKAVSYLILCMIFVPVHGLMGVAYAHVIQACILMILSWWMLKRKMPMLPAIPFRWSNDLFREMVGYGLNIQLISVSQMLYDPITKGLLAKVGGLGFVGYYEMASRMIIQLRGLLVSACQVLVPTIADMKEINPDFINKIYKEAYCLILFIAIPYYSAIIALAPVISRIWIGHYESSFVTFSVVLSIGWFVNTLVAPSYFADLGIGNLMWITRGHIIIAISNIVLGSLFGYVFGGIGVVVAWAASLIAGSLTILLSFHRRNSIPILETFPREYFLITLSSVAGFIISFFAYRKLSTDLGLFSITGLVILTIIFLSAWPIWVHPMRKRLMDIRTIYFSG